MNRSAPYFASLANRRASVGRSGGRVAAIAVMYVGVVVAMFSGTLAEMSAVGLAWIVVVYSMTTWWLFEDRK